MMKLLHERLRDWEDNGDGTVSVAGIGTEIRATRSAMEDMAYEIEKYYIPRPRFEDGEPVQFGDKFDMFGQIREVEGIKFYNDSYVLFPKYETKGMTKYGNALVKRPEAPDTLERIEDDATLEPICYYHKYIDEDSGNKTDADIIEAMVHDLLRRQREVLRCDQSS